MSKQCDLCLKEKDALIEPAAVVVPARNMRGEMLDTPGVYMLCLKCRQAVATAERAIKEKR